VVINERTGTVVIGENVKLSRVLITHANLAIMTSETPEVSQPLPFSDGETRVVPRTQVDVIEEEGLPVTMIDEQATVGDLSQGSDAARPKRDLSDAEGIRGAARGPGDQVNQKLNRRKQRERRRSDCICMKTRQLSRQSSEVS
jgi:hypothetical protein